jgi:alcohol dehydrogenase/propanol-preferring alcohol dehydrogenase
VKAAVVPRASAAWELRDVPTPRPEPGQVLIRVRACGVCLNDVLLSRGTFPFPAIDPVVTGHELAGDVVELGAGVTSRKVGDRVGATWVQGTCGRCGYCRLNLPVTGQSGIACAAPVMTGMTAQGGHAEYLAVSANSTVLIPDHVAYEVAAPVMCAGYTAWSALRAAEPLPHERVAVLGIGGLGHLAVQYSRACGFETVALTRSSDKRELAGELGASAVFASGEELRAAGGANVVLVTSSSYAAAADALQGLRHNGRMVLTTIDPTGTFSFTWESPIWANRLRIIGSTHNGLSYLAEALDIVASGAVTPMVEVFAKEQVVEAVDRVEKGSVRFRAVIRY